jgi:hypothetical protein
MLDVEEASPAETAPAPEAQEARPTAAERLRLDADARSEARWKLWSPYQGKRMRSALSMCRTL